MARADASNLVYVLEDDLEVATIIVRILREFGEFGFVVEHMSSGRDLIRRFKQRPSSACIVDLGLPDGVGISIVRALNSYSPCVVIVVTGRQDLADRVLGLEVGADDYIVKPFEGR
ncbi:response regulator transcription factor [Bradyrhizobium sp.]|uniref:response regulator transcription factor n=1 Tax=Bradyrhizobium sp. TaxID=376 RepID=UPI003BB066CB